MTCEWCRKPVPRVELSPGSMFAVAEVPPTLHRVRDRWVCASCKRTIRELNDKINALDVEIRAMVMGLDRLALPEFAGR